MRERRSRCGHHERQKAVRLLSLMLDEVSELLYASIRWGDAYPELCTCLDEFSIEVAEEIRRLGRWMLGRGIDPPIFGLCQGACRRERNPHDVICALLGREEEILQLRRSMEGTEYIFSTHAEERVRRMRRMLS